MRYQVIIYSDEYGADERQEFPRKADALKCAKAYAKEPDISSVYIYDFRLNAAQRVAGFPLSRVFSPDVTVLD